MPDRDLESIVSGAGVLPSELLVLFDLYGTLVTASGALEFAPGAIALVKELKRIGVTMGVVTSTENTRVVDDILISGGLKECFSFVVSYEDSPDHSERILAAISKAQKITGRSFERSNVFHFDDSLSRVEGSHRALINHVAVVPSPQYSLREIQASSGSDFVIRGFADKAEVFGILFKKQSEATPRERHRVR